MMTDTSAAEGTIEPPPPDLNVYALVEIMGHRTRAGVITDMSIGGKTMLRIEHPTRADHTGREPLWEAYSPDALFAVRPCSREECERMAAFSWPAAPSDRPALPSAAAEVVDYDDDEEDDYDDMSDGGRFG